MNSPLRSNPHGNLPLSGLASDVHSMDALRASASRDPKAAVQTAAHQFESLFMNELMKSMRQSTLATGMLENSGSKMGTEMLDAQFANQLTGMPGGLSKAIMKHLERQLPGSAQNLDKPTEVKPLLGNNGSGLSPSVGAEPAPKATKIRQSVSPNRTIESQSSVGRTAFASPMSGSASGVNPTVVKQLERQMASPNSGPNRSAELKSSPEIDNPYLLKSIRPQIVPAKPNIRALAAIPKSNERQLSFIKTHTHAARAAEAATGIPASFMVAQAAHESGWGRSEIKRADGTSSFNVFGIKAGKNWTGPVVEVMTTEYIGGAPRKVMARFRAYSSYEESFKDYARLMTKSPRYASVVAQASTAEGFAYGLQKAGYATDPAYAEKLSRMINTTLRLQRLVS